MPISYGESKPRRKAVIQELLTRPSGETETFRTGDTTNTNFPKHSVPLKTFKYRIQNTRTLFSQQMIIG